jgi:hypothetical protein
MKKLVFVLFLSGCANAVPFKSADGTANIYIDCPAMNMCYQKATESCPQGFNIVDRSDRSGGLVGAATQMASPAKRENITIACKG